MTKSPGDKPKKPERKLPDIICPKCRQGFLSLNYLRSHECYPENRKYHDPRYKGK